MTNPGVIALAVILGVMVFGFVGYAFHRWQLSRRDEMEREATVDRELSDACKIAEEIHSIRVYLTELRAASDAAPGGPDVTIAMLHLHPLRQRAEDRIEYLRGRLLDE